MSLAIRNTRLAALVLLALLTLLALSLILLSAVGHVNVLHMFEPSKIGWYYGNG